MLAQEAETIVVKEKTYRIHHGSRHTQKQCSLCNEKFPSQKYLNDHVLSVHLFEFLCKSRACRKEFTSQAALDKNELTHEGPRFSALFVEMDFCSNIN